MLQRPVLWLCVLLLFSATGCRTVCEAVQNRPVKVCVTADNNTAIDQVLKEAVPMPGPAQDIGTAAGGF